MTNMKFNTLLASHWQATQLPMARQYLASYHENNKKGERDG